ncbi:hypothetical protein Tco_0838252 [Tanacetum coccineum]|uniref:Uncharacterized protein n=1 Tax=Tanacetum coccineum TaxID=301880 RepID=A0ABQ5AM85_9ASTR
MLQARENLMETIQAFLNEYGHIPPEEKYMALLLAEERFHKLSKLWKKSRINLKKPKAITPNLPTEEPEYSLSIGDKHLDTISKTKSDKVIKSSVENLVPIPSESEDYSDNESECDMPVCDDFTTFSNPLFDSNDDFTSSDDKSLSNEDICIPLMPSLILSNLCLIRDTLIDSSPKFDYLLEEFSGELAHIDPIPPGIEEADFDLEEEIHLIENFLYANSSPRLPEERNSENVDTIIESASPSPIPVKDSDSHMEEIDLFLDSDDSMPPGIENDDYDSEGDIRFLEELLSNDPLPLPEIESSNLNHFNDPSSPRPPPEPPDVEICFDVEPDTTVKNDFDDLNEDECFNPGGEIDVFANVEDGDYFTFTFIIQIFLLYLTYPEVSPLLLSTGRKDIIFDPGIST